MVKPQRHLAMLGIELADLERRVLDRIDTSLPFEQSTVTATGGID
jgi:hypothetical protein